MNIKLYLPTNDIEFWVCKKILIEVCNKPGMSDNDFFDRIYIGIDHDGSRQSYISVSESIFRNFTQKYREYKITEILK